MTLQTIKQKTEKATGLVLDTPTHQRNAMIARSIYMSLAREFTTQSVSAIGAEVNRHHSSVVHCLSKLSIHLSYEPDFRKIYNTLRAEIINETNFDVVEKSKLVDLLESIPTDKYKEVAEYLMTV